MPLRLVSTDFVAELLLPDVPYQACEFVPVQASVVADRREVRHIEAAAVFVSPQKQHTVIACAAEQLVAEVGKYVWVAGLKTVLG